MAGHFLSGDDTKGFYSYYESFCMKYIIGIEKSFNILMDNLCFPWLSRWSDPQVREKGFWACLGGLPWDSDSAKCKPNTKHT